MPADRTYTRVSFPPAETCYGGVKVYVWCAIWAIALAINVACWFGYFSPQIQTTSWLLVLIAWLYWRLYAKGVLP